jgi:ketosteroid isomerase-like protein
LYAQFPAAFRAKDVDAITRIYAPGNELVVFDVTPPRQYVGFDAVKIDYQGFFAAFPGPVDRDEIQDLNVVTDGEMAYSRMVEPITVTAKDGSKFSITLRITDALRKINGKWLVTQEHISVPVDLDSGKPDLDSTP